MINNEPVFINVSHDTLTVNKKNILTYLGYKKSSKIDTTILETIDSYIAECIKSCSPRGCYLIKNEIEINKKNSILLVDGIPLEIGKKIISTLDHSTALALLICTAGKEVEEFSKSLMESGKYLEGYIVDLIGSELAEATANFIHEEIINNSKSKGLETTNRYSPGYCGWNVIEQFKLFNFFQNNPCDVSLTETALMKPIKSVSGIIGIGENVKFNPHGCKFCTFKNCRFRH